MAELLQGQVVARQLETTDMAMMATVIAHLALGEMMREIVQEPCGRAVHF